jgi:hypothetical protein
MSSKRVLLAAAILLSVAAVPHLAFAQMMGGGMAGQPMGGVMPGITDLQAPQEHTTPKRTLEDAQTDLGDADPTVRIKGLDKLGNLRDPKVNKLLIRSLADHDIRVRIKAVDLLGERGANEAVDPLSQMLFLRTTEPIVKLHVVAALGRIGDAAGALPVMQYLQEELASGGNPQDCGTAVFALGEMGNQSATPLLTKVIATDKSPMVRQLARRALEKIDGELPSVHSMRVAREKNKLVPTDEKLSKLRALDQKIQQADR